MASAGYPAKARLGDVITDLGANDSANDSADISADVIVFHAGTSLKDEQLLTAGGRVLCVTAMGETVQAARANAYKRVDQIQFDGAQYRTDIAWRALKS